MTDDEQYEETIREKNQEIKELRDIISEMRDIAYTIYKL